MCTAADPKAKAKIANQAADELRAAGNNAEADKWVAKAARFFRAAGQYPECMALMRQHHAAVLRHINADEVIAQSIVAQPWKLQSDICPTNSHDQGFLGSIAIILINSITPLN